jgi:hypothetical protein
MTGGNFARHSRRLALAVGTILAGYAGAAGAMNWRFDNGTQLVWNTSISLGASWRAQGPDRDLYSRADGQLLGLMDGRGGSNTDSATLNYELGDRVSTPLKLISDLELRKGKFGALVRAKAWYDQALEGEEVRYGHQNNDYNGGRGGLNSRNPLQPFNPCPGASTWVPGPPPTPGATPLCAPGTWPTAELSDDGFEDLQKFSGVYLLDAYAYGGFEIGDSDLQLRLGRQVVNWGESVFIQGVNQSNPVDVTSLRRPGTEIKEVLLPVAMVYANWGFSLGSIEAYYQVQWDNSPIDSCGTYWGPAEGLISARTAGCLSTASIGGQSNPVAQATGYSFSALKGREASDSGQYGVAFRFPVDALDTEFGLYAINTHAKIPVISARMGTHPSAPVAGPAALPFPIFNPAANGGLGGWFSGVAAGAPQYRFLNPADLHRTLAAAGGTGITPAGGFWEYPEDIQIFGLSAATELGGWSVAAELSYQADVPVQINGNDLLQAALLGAGPYGAEGRATVTDGEGTELRGYERFDKTQFQVNTVKTFSGVLGSQSMLLIGEVGLQSNDVPDFKNPDNVRYGRAFIYGAGPHPTYPANNPQPDGRRNDGYVTDFAWGYRVRARLNYDGLAGGALSVSPSIVWNHDVEGVAMDGQFLEDRQTLGLGLGFTYAKKYTFDLGYTWYADSAFNPLMDRDYYSATVGVTF